MKFLQDQGYRVIPVNPQITGEHVHGEFVWRELSPDRRADRHRRHLPPSDDAGEAVDEAIAVGAKAVWMQLGVINEAAAERAEAAGLKVVMDRCPKIEIRRGLGLAPVASRASGATPPSSRGTSRVGLSMPRRRRRSLAGSSVANMSFRFDAMVISLTGGPISPSTIRKPAAPRE